MAVDGKRMAESISRRIIRDTAAPDRDSLIIIAGPTASGKTALAAEAAARMNGEVVSADSMQVYMDMDIGTARPLPEEMCGVPHHLTGFLPLSEKYSVARYAQEARAVISDIFSRGKQPVMCGGTGLYIEAVADNIRFSGEGGNTELRGMLKRRAADEGAEVLLEELRAVDSESAERLHPANLGRIIRALELYHTTGMTMSEHIAASRGEPPPFRPVMFVLAFRDRERLYERINRRVDDMLERGLVEEARRVLASESAPTALQAIGYKELAPYIAGEMTLDEAVENLKRATRRYAKRQMSWFRRRTDAQVLYVDESTKEELVQAVIAGGARL